MDMPLFPYRIYAYNELVKRGYDLTVVSVSTEENLFKIPLDFKHIRLVPQRIGPFIKLRSFSSVSFVGYDTIVVAPNLRILDYYQLYRSKYWKKLVGWGHHKGRTTGNKFAEWVRFTFFKNFKSLVFYDYETPKEYIAKGFDASRLFVANNTQYVNLSTVHLYSERNSFLYVGRIQERKKIDLAIKAFYEVVKMYPGMKLKFYVVGGGDDTSLKRIIDEFNLSESVVLCGSIHDENELAKYFNSALAYVSPGHVGLGVLHSLAFGVPVITCKERKHSLEIVNCKPENSFIVDFNKESIANAMISLLNNQTFKSKSQNAYNYYKDYCTIDKMVDGIDCAIKCL